MTYLKKITFIFFFKVRLHNEGTRQFRSQSQAIFPHFFQVIKKGQDT